MRTQVWRVSAALYIGLFSGVLGGCTDHSGAGTVPPIAQDSDGGIDSTDTPQDDAPSGVEAGGKDGGAVESPNDVSPLESDSTGGVSDAAEPPDPQPDSAHSDTGAEVADGEEPEADASDWIPIPDGPPCEVEMSEAAMRQTGPQEDGTFLLPGGRAVDRPGKHLEVGGFPSVIRMHPNLQVGYLTVAGRNQRELVVFSMSEELEIQRIQRSGAFFGLEIDPQGNWLYASAGAQHEIERFPILEDGTLGTGETLSLPGFASGIALDSLSDRLWVGLLGGETLNPVAGLVEVNTLAWEIEREIDLKALVWDVLFIPEAQEIWASDLGGESILVVDRTTWTEKESISVPSAPADMVLHPDQGRVWVAVSGVDAIATLDVATHLATQWTAVTDLAWVDAEGAPLPYSNVNALAFDAVDGRLFATRGADNAVSVFDGDSMSLVGSFPTGWYPTAVGLSAGSGKLLVAEGKGYGKGPDDIALTPEELDARLRDGAVSFVDVTALDLALWSEQANAAFGRPSSLIPKACEGLFPLPLEGGHPSPIEHVILIVKENKTIDCVFGDLQDMDVDVDPSLVRWGEEITPNLHALGREFCLVDNFYTEVPNSDVGHLFLTAGHLTEFTERIWKEDAQYGLNPTFPLDDATTPVHGNLFSHLVDHGVSLRVYGEIVGMLAKTQQGAEILSYTDMSFPGGFIVNYGVTDTEKAQYVAQKISEGELAQFTYVLLPNDHTNGTAPGTPSPESMVADNDYAVGVIVDALSKSPFWEKSLVIITQDDTQGCDDHVDLQRAFAILVSPWVKRQHVSHVHTSFPSIPATLTRIFGTPPMGRGDATAMPFVDCFSGDMNAAPMPAVPRTYPPELNGNGLPGGQESAQMSWRSPDRNPGLGIILDAYRQWKMGRLTEREAVQQIASPLENQEQWEEWVEESHEDTLGFDRTLDRLKRKYPDLIPERLQ